MPAGENCAATATDVAAGSHDGQAAGCSCLPFCFWGSRGPVAPERRRRRRRFRLRLSWFSWPWLRKSGRRNEESTKKGKKRRMLLLLCTSLHAKKAFTSVSSGSSLLPKVSSFGDAKKQSRGKTRRTVDDTTATTTSAKETASARPETSSRQPCPRPADGVRRAPSRRHSLQPDRGAAEPGAGLWTMATTLGVTVFFGRVTAVIFLCSYLYGARFVRAQAGCAAKATSGGVAGGSSRRFGDQVVVDLCTEEHKKVVMEGLLDRAGTWPSSRFCK